MTAPVVISDPLDAEYTVEPLDTDLDFDAASDLVKRVRNLLSDIQDQLEETSNSITRLYHGRAWRSLGYASWEELCLAKFPIKLKLPSAERKELVVTIRKLGLSQSAIADVVGVSQRTVSNDLSELSNSAELPTETTGKDGKVRAAKKAPTTFVCPRCDKRKKLEGRVEIDGVDHCEPCAEALEEAAAHQEATETAAPVTEALSPAQEKAMLWTEISEIVGSGKATKLRAERIYAKAEALVELFS